MGDSRVACCLQGGGVYVQYPTVTITSSSIYGNTAYAVRAHVQSFPSPRWEDAPSPWETLVLFAGWWCLCPVHLFTGHDHVVLDLREQQCAVDDEHVDEFVLQ